jgi:hypothetical protein
VRLRFSRLSQGRGTYSAESGGLSHRCVPELIDDRDVVELFSNDLYPYYTLRNGRYARSIWPFHQGQEGKRTVDNVGDPPCISWFRETLFLASGKAYLKQ